jgi:hypothetical protein
MRALTLVVLCVTASCGGHANAPSTPAPAPAQVSPAPTTEAPAPAKRAPAPPSAALQVTGIAPDKGDAEGGTYVRITGNRFLADGPRTVKVYFGAREATVIRFASDHELIVQAPGAKPGEVVDVLIVFSPGGELKLANVFTFVDKR